MTNFFRMIFAHLAVGFILSTSLAQTGSNRLPVKNIVESLPSCDRALTVADNFVLASAALPSGGFIVRVIPVMTPSKTIEIETSQRPVDLKKSENTLVILYSQSFEIWNLTNRKVEYRGPSFPRTVIGTNYRSYASGMEIQHNKLFIAHGDLGIAQFDMKKYQFDKILRMPTESSATDIALISAKQALVSVDNNDSREFRGIYLMNLETFKVEKQIFIDNVLPMSVRANHRHAFVGYADSVWKFDINDILAGKRNPKPLRRAWRFPVIGAGDFYSKVSIDQKNIYACFRVLNNQTGIKDLKSLAFDLSFLKLD